MSFPENPQNPDNSVGRPEQRLRVPTAFDSLVDFWSAIDSDLNAEGITHGTVYLNPDKVKAGIGMNRLRQEFDTTSVSDAPASTFENGWEKTTERQPSSLKVTYNRGIDTGGYFYGRAGINIEEAKIILALGGVYYSLEYAHDMKGTRIQGSSTVGGIKRINIK